MATNSILHDVVIDSVDKAEQFLDALEQSFEQSKKTSRLTTERTWEEASKDLSNELGYSHIWKRLNEIENILRESYNIENVTEVVRCKDCVKAWKSCCGLRCSWLEGVDGDLLVADDDFCSYGERREDK